MFNAIRTQQKATEVAVTKVSEKHKATSAIEKARNGKKNIYFGEKMINMKVMMGCVIIFIFYCL